MVRTGPRRGSRPRRIAPPLEQRACIVGLFLAPGAESCIGVGQEYLDIDRDEIQAKANCAVLRSNEMSLIEAPVGIERGSSRAQRNR